MCECLWSEALDAVEVQDGCSRALRRVYRLTERTIDKKGQPLLLPEVVLEGWTTTLPMVCACAAFAPVAIAELASKIHFASCGHFLQNHIFPSKPPKGGIKPSR